MDDLISRQELLKRTIYNPLHGPYIIAQDVLDCPSARQWIPCEKKMPKAEEKVWIQTQSGKACFAMYEDGTISENDSNWLWYDIEYSSWDEDEDCGIIPEGWWEFTQFHPDCEFDCPVDEKVVAWMPLPEPYRKEAAE